jgi:hypothetical protein
MLSQLSRAKLGIMRNMRGKGTDITNRKGSMHWEGGRKTCLSNSSRLILPSPFMSIISIRASHEDNFNCQESTSNMKQQKTVVIIDSANWWSKT